MTGRRRAGGFLGGLSVRPFVYFAVMLLIGSQASRLVNGVLSVLVLVTVAMIGTIVAATVRTARVDARRARLSQSWWHALPPVVPAPTEIRPNAALESVDDTWGAA